MATLRIRVPRDLWLGVFSLRHPGVRLEFLNHTELSPDVSVSDVWISGLPAGRWTPELAAFSEVEHLESLTELGGGGLYRVTFQNPPIVRLYRALGLPLPLPVWIQGGQVGWEVVARHSDYRRILEFAARRGLELRTVAVRRGPLHGHLPTLTPFQERVLEAALAAGYFGAPRRSNLSDLARRLGRSRSVISETISAIEQRLLDSALTGSSILRLRSPGPRSRKG